LHSKIGPNVGLCHLCDFLARHLDADLAGFVALVRGVPAASPAGVIDVPGEVRLRIWTAPLAVTSWRSPTVRHHHYRCDDRDHYGTAVLPARSRCLHLMSGEIGGGSALVLAPQLHFGEIVAAVLPLTDPSGKPQVHRTGEFLQSRRFDYRLRMRKGCDG
jgi:hypothetical protein